MKKTVAALLTAVAILLSVLPAGAEEFPEIYDGIIFCNPETYLNVREGPGKQYAICGFLGCGDTVQTDCETRGEWIHLVGFGECDGWIMDCYLTFDRVTVLETPEKMKVTGKSTPVRVFPNGKIRKRIKKGTSVTVIAVAGEWTLTKIGYIKTELIDMPEAMLNDETDGIGTETNYQKLY